MDSQIRGAVVNEVINTGIDKPSTEIAECIARLEGCDTRDLPEISESIDGTLRSMFSHPRAADAKMRVEFSYHGYRIIVDQLGIASFVELDGLETASDIKY